VAGAAQNQAPIKLSEWRSAGPFALPRAGSGCVRLNAGTILTDGRALLLLETH
jgi:hypothetical protein